MELRWALLLVVPLAAGLVWLIRRLRGRAPVVAVLGVVVVLLVWGLMSFIEWYRPWMVTPDEAFASVEMIMDDSVMYDWLYRYIAWYWGWLVALGYFIACWAYAWFGPGSRRGREQAGAAG